MNQADIFYFSGHGLHGSGDLMGGGISCNAATVTPYWSRELKCVIIAGCSVLDINDYNGHYSGDEHIASPGKAWAATGPEYLLGYNQLAPGDKKGAPSQIVSYWKSHYGSEGHMDAWMNANAQTHAWNACAIQKNVRYLYFKRFFLKHKVIDINYSEW